MASLCVLQQRRWYWLETGKCWGGKGWFLRVVSLAVLNLQGLGDEWSAKWGQCQHWELPVGDCLFSEENCPIVCSTKQIKSINIIIFYSWFLGLKIQSTPSDLFWPVNQCFKCPNSRSLLPKWKCLEKCWCFLYCIAMLLYWLWVQKYSWS